MNLTSTWERCRRAYARREIRIPVLYSLFWSAALFLGIPVTPDQQSLWAKAVTASLFYVLLFVSVLICTLFLWRQVNNDTQAADVSTFSKKQAIRIGLAAALPCGLIWLFYFLAFYPAIMNFDVISQWEQLTSKHFNDWHPVFHTLYLFALQYLGWGSPAAVSTAQIIFLLAIFVYLIFFLQRANISELAIFSLTVYFALFPLIGLYNITLWKDTPFSFCLLLLTIFNIQIFLSDGKWLASKTHCVFFILCLVGVGLFRHNGIIPAAFSLLALFWICPGYWKTISTVGSAFLVIILLIKYPVYGALQVPEHSNIKHVLNAIPCIYMVGGVVAADRPIRDEEKNALTGFMPMEAWRKNYNPQDVVSLVWHAKPDWSYLISQPGRKNFRSTCIRLVLRNPNVVLKNLVHIGSYEWRIRELPSDTYSYVIEYDSDPAILHVMPNNLGIKAQPLAPFFHQFIIDSVFFPIKGKYSNAFRNKDGASAGVNWFLYRPALFYWLSIYCLGLLALRLGSAKIMLLGAPLLTNAIVITLLSFTFETRYNYPAFLIAPVFLSLFFIKWPNRAAAAAQP